MQTLIMKLSFRLLEFVYLVVVVRIDADFNNNLR